MLWSSRIPTISTAKSWHALASPATPHGANMAARWFYQLRKVCHVLALCLPMLIAFATVIIPIACTLAWYHGTNPLSNEHLPPAVICGLIASLFVVVFHVKRETTL